MGIQAHGWHRIKTDFSGGHLSINIKVIPRKSRVIVLDFDDTYNPIHCSHKGRFFNGYYRNYCYLPIYCFYGKIPH